MSTMLSGATVSTYQLIAGNGRPIRQDALARFGQALRTIGEAAAITRPLEGSYYAVDQGARVQWLWSGSGARTMHAALARLFNANGVEAQDMPGIGVWTARA